MFENKRTEKNNFTNEGETTRRLRYQQNDKLHNFQLLANIITMIILNMATWACDVANKSTQVTGRNNVRGVGHFRHTCYDSVDCIHLTSDVTQ